MGTDDADVKHKFEFQVRKCNEKSQHKNPEVECATPEEIEKYIHELEIHISVVENIVDFNEREGEPVIPIQRVLSSDLLETKIATILNLELRLN